MRRTPVLRQENQIALAIAEIERLKAITTRTTDGRVIVSIPGSTPGDSHTSDGNLVPLETSPHVLYGSKHTNSFRVTAAEGVSLTIFIQAGQVWAGGSFRSLVETTLQMADATTNYVYVSAAGAIASNAVSFPADGAPLATVVTVGGDITSVNDRRSYLSTGGAVVGSLHDSDQLIDDDGDTSVEVERGADDDTIRLKAATVDVALIASAGQWQLPISGINAGLLVGGDALWYRDAANEWRTPDAVRIDGNLRMANAQYLSWLNTASAQVDIMRLNSSDYVSIRLEAAQWRFEKNDNSSLATFSLGLDPVFQFYRNTGIDRRPEGAGTQAIHTISALKARSTIRLLRQGAVDTRIKFDIGTPNNDEQDPTLEIVSYTGAFGAEVPKVSMRFEDDPGFGGGTGIRIPRLGAYGVDNQFRVGSAGFGGNIHVYFDSFTAALSGTYIEHRPQMVAQLQAGDSSVIIIGSEAQAGISGPPNVDFTGNFIAARGRIKIPIAAAKTVSLGTGFQAYVQINPDAETGILTEWRAFDVGVRQVDGGSITNVKGLYIPDISAWGTGLNIAIHSLGGEHRFVGDVIIGLDAVPTAALDVRGDALITDTLSLSALVPATVGSAIDNQKLLTFGIDRAWVFEAIGVGAASHLGLRAMNDQKRFTIQSQDSTNAFDFFTANSVAATILTITGNLVVSANARVSGGLGVGVTETNAGRLSIGDADFNFVLAGDFPLITFDVDDSLRYDRAANLFDFIFGGAVIVRMETGIFTPLFNQNNNFNLQADGATAFINFDTNDRIVFTQATDAMDIVINSVIQSTIDANGRFALPIQGVGAGLLLGNDVHLYRSAPNMLFIADSVTILQTLLADDIIERTAGEGVEIETAIIRDGKLWGEYISPESGIGTHLSMILSGNEITDAVRALALSGDGLVAPDSSMGVWEATTNLITNGGFETNLTGWTIFQLTLTRDTTEFLFGTASMKVDTGVNSLGDTGISADMVALDVEWQYSMYIREETGIEVTSAIVTARYADRDANAVAAFTHIIDVGGGWYKCILTGLHGGAGSEFAAVRVAGVGRIVHIDGMQVEIQKVSTPYVETDGGTASRSDARIRADVSGLFTATQGWAAFRVRMGYANTDASAGEAILFNWADAADDLIELRYDLANNQWEVERADAGSGTVHVVADTFALGQEITIIMTWTAAAIRLSVDGGAFTSSVDTNIPTLAATTVDLGSDGSGSQFNGDIIWAVFGNNILTDNDVRLMNACRKTIPKRSSFTKVAGPTFLWDGNTGIVSASPLIQDPDLIEIDYANRQIGFFGVTPISRPSVYTQTFATADKTHANPTASAPGDLVATNNGWGASTEANFDLIHTTLDALVADMADIKQLVNAVIDDLQAYGILQ